MMKTYTVHTVLYHVDGPGKFGDGESSMHFRHRRDAEEFARGKRYYSGPDEPIVTLLNMFNCQACVPASWTYMQVEELVEDEQPCGVSMGWKAREGRVPCADREGFVHVVVGT